MASNALPKKLTASELETGAYGQIYVHDGVTAQTLTAQNTYYVITAFNTAQGVNGSYYGGITVDKANNKVTVSQAGIYLVFISVSFAGTGSATFYGTALKNGNTELDQVHFTRKLGTAGDVGSASSQGIVSLAANDYLTIGMKSTSGAGDSVTPQDAQLTVIRLS